jgi:hypothetical protein
MVVSKKDDTMESMSNTRQEIANRLGSLARPGVSKKFEVSLDGPNPLAAQLRKQINLIRDLMNAAREPARKRQLLGKIQVLNKQLSDMMQSKDPRFNSRSGAKTTMGMKLVKTVPAGSNGLSAKIYRDSDYNSYIVKFFENGKHNANADYDTEDLQDAVGTAEYSISHYKAARPGTKAKFADWLTPHQYKAIEQENKSVSDEILRLKSDINRLTQKMLGLTSGSEKELLVGKIQTKTQTMKDFQSSLAKANARLARLNAPIFTRPGSKANMAAASGAPDTSAFAERIKKYAARNSKDEMVDAKVIKEDVRALNAVLMYVKAGDRNRAVKWVDSMDTLVSDVIPRSIYNWIYKGYSARPGVKAKMAERTELDLKKADLRKGIASINKSISASEANLRDHLKNGHWNNAVGYCQSLSSLYLRLREAYIQWNNLVQSTDYSRPGVKAKFEYSQSDYMALRRYYQLAMTGNPDVFEDNTAMRLANKAIASPNYRPSSSAAWSHDLAKELIDGFEGM